MRARLTTHDASGALRIPEIRHAPQRLENRMDVGDDHSAAVTHNASELTDCRIQVIDVIERKRANREVKRRVLE